MLDTFVENARKTGAQVDIINKSAKELQKCIKAKIKNTKNIIFAEPQIHPRALFELFMKNAPITNNPNIPQLATSTIGIGEAFAAVARTGSVCISLDSPLLGLEGLLPYEHIVVLDAAHISKRPMDIFNLAQTKKIKNGWLYITGPSATADMGELVKGAHGPGRLHIIIVQD